MIELVFKVDRNSDFYIDYFKSKDERKLFTPLVESFLKRHNLDDVQEYYQKEYLGLKLNDEQRNKLKGQLLKHKDKNGMSLFKQKSTLQKTWNQEVTNAINFDIMTKLDFWWLEFIKCGQYNLWDYNDEIYGYLMDKHQDNIELPSYFKKIKMSEYYKVIESMESK